MLIGSFQTLERHVTGLACVIYEGSQALPSLCSTDAGGVSLLKMLFHFLLDLPFSECITELHLESGHCKRACLCSPGVHPNDVCATSANSLFFPQAYICEYLKSNSVQNIFFCIDLHVQMGTCEDAC